MRPQKCTTTTITTVEHPSLLVAKCGSNHHTNTNKKRARICCTCQVDSFRCFLNLGFGKQVLKHLLYFYVDVVKTVRNNVSVERQRTLRRGTQKTRLATAEIRKRKPTLMRTLSSSSDLPIISRSSIILMLTLARRSLSSCTVCPSAALTCDWRWTACTLRERGETTIDVTFRTNGDSYFIKFFGSSLFSTLGASLDTTTWEERRVSMWNHVEIIVHVNFGNDLT